MAAGMQDGAALPMSTRWHIGAKQLRGAIASYAKRFDFLEVKIATATANNAPQGGRQPPRGASHDEPTLALSTLRRWRKAVPPPFHFAVVAGPQVARLRASKGADEEIEAVRAAIDVLQARCFVLRTPPEVTPASVWRDRIAKLVDRIPHDVTHFVWEPSGVWETADAALYANQLGAFLAVDPTRELVPSGSVAYVRLRALGAAQAFGTASLERVVTAVGARREVFAVVETESAVREAKRLREILRRGPAEGGPSAGRLVRPRRSIVVGDDEQE
jgi:uncharacterized protein YecE (DUF72 family)